MPRRLSSDPVYGADVLCLAEAACRLGMHPDTYKKGVREGRLPGICVDTKYVIPREWYERMLRGDWCPQQDKEVAA